MKQVSAEEIRLEQDRRGEVPWRRWGPYVSERSWGTVREDNSPNGEAWDSFPHDHARSRAYRWGEDGLAGLCDRYQLLVFGLALWNGRDPILKERLFGLVPREGNHGEDVKECYFYLDATPTHSYLRYLYKYPQVEFPYCNLIQANQRRDRNHSEFELPDTGIFEGDRYFDVFVEYAKASPEDICIRIEICNRGPAAAEIHLLPQLWFRNTWAWSGEPRPEPVIRAMSASSGSVGLHADDRAVPPLSNLLVPYRVGERFLYGEAGAQLLFTNNDTNFTRLFGPHIPNRTEFVKDAFHRYIIEDEDCVNPAQTGTKAAFHYASVQVPAGGSRVFRFRLTDRELTQPLVDVETVVAQRRREADEFYEGVHPKNATADERLVQRQALAGMIWSKQLYLFDVRTWLEGDDPDGKPPPASRMNIRNAHWKHLNSMRILSMPDKWEYPWFAAWDLAFHCLPLALIDPEFAKEQLWLLLFEQFQHPNGQIPAYEWEFSDLNPPVHAWAVWRVYQREHQRTGRRDRVFLQKCFHKLLINFAWWVNRVDADGHNVFEGGFLGLDNITVVDRSQRLPEGATLKQSDATGWMGMFCLNMMRIALELSAEEPAYLGLATKFFEHYAYIGAALKHMGGRNFELWSQRDGFFYDALCYADGTYDKFRVRSLVGLIPLFAVEVLDDEWIARYPEFHANFHWFLRNRSSTAGHCVTTLEQDQKKTHVLALLDSQQLRRVLSRVWDPNEFRGQYGLRSLSKYHQEHPFQFGGQEVRFEPAESRGYMKGGNSNWRGPIWFPTTFLMIESLVKLSHAYDSTLTVPSTAPEEPDVSLAEMARGFANRLIALFTRDATGHRPAHGQLKMYQQDPHWRDLVLFYEYFHGDTGSGLGASHQTGWTGLVATLLDEWRQ